MPCTSDSHNSNKYAIIICTYLTRHMLELADSGQLAMDWLDVGEKDVDLPVLVILPGLTG